MTFNYTVPVDKRIYQNKSIYNTYTPLQYKSNFVDNQTHSFTPFNPQTTKNINDLYTYKPTQYKTLNWQNPIQPSFFNSYKDRKMINQQSQEVSNTYNGTTKLQLANLHNNSNNQKTMYLSDYNKKNNFSTTNYKSDMPQNSSHGYPLIKQEKNQKTQNYSSYSNYIPKTSYQTPSYGFNFNEPSSIINNKNQTFFSNQNLQGQSKRSLNKKIQMTYKKQSFIPLRKTKQQMESDNEEDMEDNKKVYDMLEINKIKNFKQQDFDNKCGFNKNVMYNIDTEDDKKNSSILGRWC